MSYQVFARKYRPQNFDSVIGQEHITQTLKNAIEQNRLAHAYLFVGPRGTGKTSTARILAKALNCVKGPTVNPCGVCDVCVEIAQGNSLDVLEIDGASNNGVEQVRELRENVRFAPTRGQYKIYIIDEVHMLTSAAFNALLKTLEEPPAHVKFIFATTEPQKVLPTILSRCQRFDLRRIPAPLISSHLLHIASEEKFVLDETAAQAIAKGAEGGLRDAESMLDQLVAFCGDRITEQDVLSIFGFTAQQTVSNLCGLILAGNAPEALGMVYEQSESGRDLTRLMTDLISHLRDLLVAKADPDGIKAELGEEALLALKSQSESISMDRLLELIEQFAAAETRMKWAPNKKLHFEIAVIKAIQTLGQTTLTEIIDTLAVLRGGGEPSLPKPQAPIPRIAPKPAPTVSVKSTMVKAVEKKNLDAEPACLEERGEGAAATTAAPIVSEPKKTVEPIHPEPLKAETISLEECGGDSTATQLDEVRPPWEEPAAPAIQDVRNVVPTNVVPTIPPIVPAPEPVASPQPVQPAPITDADLWTALLSEIRAKRPLISSWIEAGTLLGIQGSLCILGFPKDKALSIDQLTRPNNKKFIEEIIFLLMKRPLSLKCEIREGLTIVPPVIPEKKIEPPADPMSEFKNDPLIKKALEIFQAEIQ